MRIKDDWEPPKPKCFATADWNMDGTIDYRDNTLELVMQQRNVDNFNRGLRNAAITRAIIAHNYEHVDNALFEQLCAECGIDMDDFTQSDISDIQRRLDEYGRIKF